MTSTALLDLSGISKTFNGVKVLDDVDLAVAPGQIMALVGENGAGKSTLMRIVSGIYEADPGGGMRLAGQPFLPRSPRQAMEAGVAIIHQELNLLPGLTVAENMFLGREPVTALGFLDRGEQTRRTRALMARLKQPVDPAAEVGRLRVGQQQMVEIARALSLDAQVIIMDEPTDALAETETAVLFDVIRDLARQGKGIIYISHRLGEVFSLCHAVTILRDGRKVFAGRTADLTEAALIRHMVGREITDQYPHLACPQGPVRLKLAKLTADGISDISFEARAGEVVGFAGLMGAGRTELAKAIYRDNRCLSGAVEIDGRPVTIRHPGAGMRAGIAYVPEDRKAEGLIQAHGVRPNMALGALRRFASLPGFVSPRQERAGVARYMAAFAVRAADPEAPVAALSGGNQQKVSLAKALMAEPSIVILDEPTRGVDVGARREIYTLINDLKAKGLAILLMSSDMPELLGMSDRILVMARGRISGELSRQEASQDAIMTLAVA